MRIAMVMLLWSAAAISQQPTLTVRPPKILTNQDVLEGREPNYARYEDRFDPRVEPFFRRGYADGYYSAR